MNSRYFRIFLLISLLSFSFTGIYAQLELKLQLMPDGASYGVFVRTTGGLMPTNNTITASGQITVVMPLDFEWDNLVSFHGAWISNAAVVAPPENTIAKYVSFGLQNDDPPILYSNTDETLLFTFRNIGGCPDFLYLIDCYNGGSSDDPFCFPNSSQTNPGNDLAVFDFGNGNATLYNVFSNYALFAWDCKDSDGDGILNAHEDTNGNGVFDPGEDASDLFDPNDPNGDGGLRLSLQLMPNGESWGIYALPVGGLSPSENTTTIAGRTEIVAPLGFEIDSVVSHAGTWVHDTSIDGPLDNQSRSYLGFTLVADDPPIVYQENEPTLLFSIHRSGSCPDSLNIIDEETDPVVLACTPSQNNLCIFNILNVIDYDVVPVAEYYYVGNYSTSAWSCQDNDGDGVLNAHEDHNGDGQFTPDSDETDLNDPCDPFFPISALLTYGGEDVICAGSFASSYLAVDVQGPVSTYQIEYTDGQASFIVSGYESGQQIPVEAFGGAAYKLLAVTDENGCPVSSDQLGDEIFIGQEGPVIYQQQPNSLIGCSGNSASLEALVANQGNGLLQFQWQFSCDDGITWTDVLDGGSAGYIGAQTESLILSYLNPSTSGCQYRLAAKTATCEPIYSDVVEVKTEGPISIDQQPIDREVCAGNVACFSLTASNAGEGDLGYQWEVAQAGSSVWTNLINIAGVTGALSSQLCIDDPIAYNNLNFRALVRTENCDGVYSNIVSLRSDGPLQIETIPVDLQVESFETAIFNTTVSNAGPGSINYQWQVSSDGITWTNLTDGSNGINQITGAQSPSLTISPAAGMDGRRFRLLASTDICSEIFSPPANLTVNGTQLTLVDDLDEPVIEICNDGLIILVVSYDNTEGVPANMLWETSADGTTWTPIATGTIFQTANQADVNVANRFNAILSILANYSVDNQQFRCTLLSSSGLSVQSATTQVIVKPPVIVFNQPVSATVCVNEGHTFSASVSDYDELVQYWTMSNDGGETWETIEDQSPTGFGGFFENTETSDLSITSVEGLHGYQFQLIAMNGPCAAVTQAVTLSVEDSPQCFPASHFVDYKLKLRPDGESWGVWVKAVGDFQPTGDNTATSGRIVIAASNGFSYYDIKSQAGGNWSAGKYKLNDATSGMSYYTFDLEPGSNPMNLQAGNEIMLFSFRKMGACPDDIYLAHEYVPNGLEPNIFTGIDLGGSEDQVFGLNNVYGFGEANCNGGLNYGINPNTNNPFQNTNADQLSEGKMTVAPNPATDWLDIKVSNVNLEGNMTHSIMTANGVVVKKIAAQKFAQRVELDDLPTGLYLLTFELNGKIISQEKFIKK